MTSDDGGWPPILQEPELISQGIRGVDKDVLIEEERQPSAERLNAPRQFYAVVKGTKVGLFESCFVAANQVLNVPGSLQERFSSRREAL